MGGYSETLGHTGKKGNGPAPPKGYVTEKLPCQGTTRGEYLKSGLDTRRG